MIACQYGREDVVKLLLEYPEVIDINIPENFYLSEEIENLIELHSTAVQKKKKIKTVPSIFCNFILF